MGPGLQGTYWRLRARCPECLAWVYLRDTVQMWAPITCPECHTALEVVEMSPILLDYLPDSDEPGDYGYELDEEA